MDENKPSRHWLSFGIRDLLWAMVVVAMGLAWWGDRWQLCYRYDDYISKRYNFRHMRGPHWREVFEPASDDPTHWRFHTKEGYDPFGEEP